MHCRIASWIAATLLLSAAQSAAAVSIDAQATSLTPLLPARGTYYDATKSGTGIAVDVSQNGFVFLTYYGYDAMGVPTWYSVQGQWSPASEAQRIATGVIGTLSQPLLRSSGGQCLTCDFTSKPAITPQPYTVTASWTTPRHVDVTIGSQTWHMDAGKFGDLDEDLPVGTWQASISWGYDPRLVFVAAQAVATQVGLVQIGPKLKLSSTPPVIFNVMLDQHADPNIVLPPKGAYYYLPTSAQFACPPVPATSVAGGAFVDVLSAINPSTDSFAGNPSLVPVLWYDPTTRRGGLDLVTKFMGVDSATLVLGPSNIHFDVYVEPDRIVGHGIVQGANTNNIPGLYWAPNIVTLNLVLQRLPSGVTGQPVRPTMCSS
ncbi:MAG: hypothetical protein E6K53_03230 [Gammaproteobacteria bacterium]|nr:MAG: hypothetical protein E6K53_03230 [Gammaproteobacteria bacterium]